MNDNNAGSRETRWDEKVARERKLAAWMSAVWFALALTFSGALTFVTLFLALGLRDAQFWVPSVILVLCVVIAFKAGKDAERAKKQSTKVMLRDMDEVERAVLAAAIIHDDKAALLDMLSIHGVDVTGGPEERKPILLRRADEEKGGKK